MDQILITLRNPWSGAYTEQDVTDLTEHQLDAYARFIEDDLRERRHDELAPCSPGVFLKAWADSIGPEEAGRVILGS